MTAAYTTQEEYFQYLSDPSFHADHHRLVKELASRVGEEVAKEFDLDFELGADPEFIHKQANGLAGAIGIYFGLCAARYYSENQPHITYRTVRPHVIVADLNKQMDLFCTTCGVSELHKWFYTNDRLIYNTIEVCISLMIPKELQDTVSTNKSLVQYWVGTTGYDFTVGDEEPAVEEEPALDESSNQLQENES
jgi:hypothetical protein